MEILTVKEVEHLSFRLARELMHYNEPIPDFSTRYPHKLESCIATPFQSFGGKDLYPTLVSKGSVLFYLMIKNHPFQNGNKRIAMTTLFVFLHMNKKWMKVDTQELYNFTVWIASSPPQFKDEALKTIEKFIKEHLIEI